MASKDDINLIINVQDSLSQINNSTWEIPKDTTYYSDIAKSMYNDLLIIADTEQSNEVKIMAANQLHAKLTTCIMDKNLSYITPFYQDSTPSTMVNIGYSSYCACAFILLMVSIYVESPESAADTHSEEGMNDSPTEQQNASERESQASDESINDSEDDNIDITSEELSEGFSDAPIDEEWEIAEPEDWPMEEPPDTIPDETNEES